MAIEIERKFLVNKFLWEKVKPPKGKEILQCYLFSSEEGSGRVRIKSGKGYLTVKGSSKGFSRAEFEYEIPKEDALALMNLFPYRTIAKVRYELMVGGKLWEVDEFIGRNKGLLVAEIELKHADESFEKPEWVGEEVSEDLKYTNSQLAICPFSEW
jgi:adenylate cyclase